jgi:hypothetical protein
VRKAVLQRRFLRPESASFWAFLFIQIVSNDEVTVEVYKTWYGSKVIVWLSQETS